MNDHTIHATEGRGPELDPRLTRLLGASFAGRPSPEIALRIRHAERITKYLEDDPEVLPALRAAARKVLYVHADAASAGLGREAILGMHASSVGQLRPEQAGLLIGALVEMLHDLIEDVADAPRYFDSKAGFTAPELLVDLARSHLEQVRERALQLRETGADDA